VKCVLSPAFEFRCRRRINGWRWSSTGSAPDRFIRNVLALMLSYRPDAAERTLSARCYAIGNAAPGPRARHDRARDQVARVGDPRQAVDDRHAGRRCHLKKPLPFVYGVATASSEMPVGTTIACSRISHSNTSGLRSLMDRKKNSAVQARERQPAGAGSCPFANQLPVFHRATDVDKLVDRSVNVGIVA